MKHSPAPCQHFSGRRKSYVNELPRRFKLCPRYALAAHSPALSMNSVTSGFCVFVLFWFMSCLQPCLVIGLSSYRIMIVRTSFHFPLITISLFQRDALSCLCVVKREPPFPVSLSAYFVWFTGFGPCSCFCVIIHILSWVSSVCLCLTSATDHNYEFRMNLGWAKYVPSLHACVLPLTTRHKWTIWRKKREKEIMPFNKEFNKTLVLVLRNGFLNNKH